MPSFLETSRPTCLSSLNWYLREVEQQNVGEECLRGFVYFIHLGIDELLEFDGAFFEVLERDSSG